MAPEKDLDTELQERFAQLPKVVQEAITSADVEQHLRTLADTHKLHLDQWEKLENEVMMTLLGFQKTEDLQKNIERAVGADAATAASLASDISTIVFEPIRQELERQLGHPAAVAAQTSGMDDMRARVLADTRENPIIPPTATAPVIAPNPAVTAPVVAPAPAVPAAPTVAPATPPTPPPAQKVERAAIAPPYTAAPSHERKTIEGDPYREQLG